MVRFNTLAFIAILLLGAFLRIWRLDANGYGTEYYAAGVRSMLESWHLLVFNAFDPAGFVSLDKPPVAFWIQAASAWVFGFNGLSLMLPQVVEGLLSVAILRHLVRRHFGEAAGLLAAIGAVFAARRTNTTWPLAPAHGSLLLWSGWALTYGVVFSFAGGIFHAYYLAVLAPPVAALAAIGLVSTWSAPQRWPWPLALLTTAAWQAYIGIDLAQGRVDDIPTLLLGALAIGTLLASLRVSRWALAGLLVLPTAWAMSSALATGNVMLPSASLARVVAPFDSTRHTGVRSFPVATEDARLLAFLEANHGGERFALATPNARLAAPVIVRTGLPVMAFGGFMGTDPILAPDALRQMVERGEVRFVILSGRGSFGLSANDEERRRAFAGWVRRNGTRVEPAEWRGLDPWQDQRQPIGLYDLRPAAGLVRIAP